MLESLSSHFSRILMASLSSRARIEQCFLGGAPAEDAGLHHGTVSYKRHTSLHHDNQSAWQGALIVRDQRMALLTSRSSAPNPPRTDSPGHLLPAQFIFSTAKCTKGEMLLILLPRIMSLLQNLPVGVSRLDRYLQLNTAK